MPRRVGWQCRGCSKLISKGAKEHITVACDWAQAKGIQVNIELVAWSMNARFFVLPCGPRDSAPEFLQGFGFKLASPPCCTSVFGQPGNVARQCLYTPIVDELRFAIPPGVEQWARSRSTCMRGASCTRRSATSSASSSKVLGTYVTILAASFPAPSLAPSSVTDARRLIEGTGWRPQPAKAPASPASEPRFKATPNHGRPPRRGVHRHGQEPPQ